MSSILGYIFAPMRIRNFYLNIDAIEELQIEISAVERASKRQCFPSLRPQQTVSAVLSFLFVSLPTGFLAQ